MLLTDFTQLISENLTVAVITAILGPIILFFIRKYYTDNQKSLDSKKKNKLLQRYKQDVNIEYVVDEKVWKILEMFHADRVYICRFHNGTRFKSDKSMEKFSMTNEAISTGMEPISALYKNRLLSEYISLLKPTIYKGYFLCENVNNLYNQKLIRELEKNNIQAFFLFKIQNSQDIPYGFLGIAFKEATFLDDDQINHLLDLSENFGVLLDYSENFKIIYNDDDIHN